MTSRHYIHIGNKVYVRARNVMGAWETDGGVYVTVDHWQHKCVLEVTTMDLPELLRRLNEAHE